MRECPEFNACHRIRADRGGGWRRARGTERSRSAAGPSIPDPFVVPEEASAADAIGAIAEELAMFDDWMER